MTPIDQISILVDTFLIFSSSKYFISLDSSLESKIVSKVYGGRYQEVPVPIEVNYISY